MPGLLNRAGVNVATTGTGTITAGSTITGFQSLPNAGAVDGYPYTYRLEDGAGWELGWGIYNSAGGTLTRNLIASSTGALLSLSGNAMLFGDALASDFPQSVAASLRLEISGANILAKPQDGFMVPTAGGVMRRLPSAGISVSVPADRISRATTNRVIASSIATLTFGTSHTWPVGGRVFVENIGATTATIRAAYDGPRIITAVGANTISFVADSASSGTAADVTGGVYPLLFIYLYWTGSALALEASMTGYEIDEATGLMAKIGDHTRFLVGMGGVYGTGFVNSTQRRWLRNYYNRDKPVARADATQQWTLTAPTAFTFVNPEMRAYLAIWADESAMAQWNGGISQTVFSNLTGCLGVNGFNDIRSSGAAVPPSGGNISNLNCMIGGPYVNEGINYAEPMMSTASGNVNQLFASNVYAPSTRMWVP